MNTTVLVDTGVWSLAYRRRPEQLSSKEVALVDELKRLGTHDDAALISAVRFETLCGIKDKARYAKVRGYLSAFRSLPMRTSTYDLAAEFFNLLRGKGVAAGSIDLFVAATAVERDVAVFTVDKDFPRYARHLPIRLHVP